MQKLSMRLVVIAVAVLIPVLLWLMQTHARSVDLSWDYDYVHDPPCADARTKTCVRGFNVLIGDPKSHPQPVFVPNRFDAKGQIMGKNITTTQSFEAWGNVQFCVTALGVSARGVMVESTPICVSKFVVPFGNMGATVHIKP